MYAYAYMCARMNVPPIALQCYAAVAVFVFMSKGYSILAAIFFVIFCSSACLAPSQCAHRSLIREYTVVLIRLLALIALHHIQCFRSVRGVCCQCFSLSLLHFFDFNVTSILLYITIFQFEVKCFYEKTCFSVVFIMIFPQRVLFTVHSVYIYVLKKYIQRGRFTQSETHWKSNKQSSTHKTQVKLNQSNDSSFSECCNHKKRTHEQFRMTQELKRTNNRDTHEKKSI